MGKRTIFALALFLQLGAFGSGGLVQDLDLPRSSPPRFLAFVRALQERAYVDYWIEYYLSIGFDELVIFHTLPPGQRLARLARPGVVREERVNSTNDDAIRGLAARVLSPAVGAEWVFLVDMDEFLVLDTATIGQYVAKVEEANGKTDVIMFRWAMVEHTRTWCSEDSIDDIARACGATPHTQHKAMARPGSITDWASPHMPHMPPRGRLSIHYDGHFRRIKASHFKRFAKFAPVGMNESSLVHVYTRSIADLLLKAATTKLPDKRLGSLEPLARFFHAAPALFDDAHALLDAFIRAAGLKAALPIGHQALRWPQMRAAEPWLADDLADTKLAALFTSSAANVARLRTRGVCDRGVEQQRFERLVLRPTGCSRAQYEHVAEALARAYAHTIRRRDASLFQHHFPFHYGRR
jgi:hypothetical protein